eukprot:CAMPEP_0114576492 /NCGR_PEP_ID=MMETSP0125-20121206/1244_1 /TAXON_ID=485358 ORGANISM="Aristerostoma sp., Strain ATCC 50986" /NCGR_SAMPLE_ID=MMETSP0125 /ASSEMBLY_ACC=CAM_ASM_000245 /LENGTH=194 /DNA_ID=CAMNT_0001765041 /DNA_START=700 /DNA_END=1282 /DNA_ORIENTATION=-
MDSCIFRDVFLPEFWLDLLNSVDSKAIKGIVSNNTLHPIEEQLSSGAVILIKIWEVVESANLDFGKIVPVLDLALDDVGTGVKGDDLREIGADWPDMVGNYIEHDPKTSIMGGIDHVGEIFLGTEIGIELVKVDGSITVIGSLEIEGDRGDPDCIKAHAFDVFEIVGNALPGASTVEMNIRAGISGTVCSGKSV